MTTPNSSSPLRQRMNDDMVARKLALRTQRGHVFACTPLCNQRRHPPMPESVNYWTPIPSQAGQLFHADSHTCS